LVRLGYLRQTAEKFSTLELTQEGMDVLRTRQAITLTRPMETPRIAERHEGQIACDEGLFARLRQLRKRLADENNVAAYVIFSDVTLRLMAREYPVSDADFGRLSGVGEIKRRQYGPVFCAEIADYVKSHPRQVFADSLKSWKGPSPRTSTKNTARESWDLFQGGLSVNQVARKRDLGPRTVVQHLAEIIATGERCDLRRFFSADEQAEMETVFATRGMERLAIVKEAVSPSITYEQLQICRAAIEARRRTT